MSFVHLRVHTEFSLADSLIRVDPPKRSAADSRSKTLSLAQAAAARGLPACAVTDRDNLFAMVKFYKSAEGAGIKPIIGADVWIEPETDGEAPSRLTLLVRDNDGYRNLTRLISRAYTDGQSRGQPLISRAWIAGLSGGLIALSGVDGDIGVSLLSGRSEIAGARLNFWRGLFPDCFYLEITRCGRPDDQRHLQQAVALARRSGVPVVATNDVRFLDREDFDAHEARSCIAQGRVLDDPRRARAYSAEQYLKSAAEMQALFADLPQAIDNALEIARRCTLTLSFGQNHLPRFPVPEGRNEAEFLCARAREGLAQRLAVIAPARPVEEYRQRLEYELKVIEQMGFPGYFLVVADFIAWAKSNGVPVGPGRGSGAGSLVAYATGITDLDPLPYDLLFERFLNPDRVSLPDFDVDFCMDGRDKVIDYVARRYGRDHVGQIITYQSMASRAVVRDVTRVLGQPYGLGDRIAKLIPGIPAFKAEAEKAGYSALEYALREVPELKHLYEIDDDVRGVIDLGLKLEDLTRGVGKHAGGVVIAPQPLTDYAPLFCEAGGSGLVTQFDMKDLESVGLVKFDFLGLKTLTVVQAAVEMIFEARNETIDVLKLPLDDAETYRLFASGRTGAVFQMESGGMQRASVDLKPDCFEDIIALISLYRPGPMELIPDYVARKHGRAEVSYLHPAMEAALKPTFGIFVYQEQVMQIAQRLAGYTLGGADLLRRAMGKKKADEMATQRAVFTEGALTNAIDAQTATSVFDLMEKFANYGFNKSHAAAYALVSYQTAWLKTHYPAEFMAAVLSCDMDHTDTIVLMLDECRRMGLIVAAPDVNRSQYKFTVFGTVLGARGGGILYGLGAIRGVGEAALEGILAERSAGGAFRDLFDFCRRIDTRKVNKRVLEALIGAGALDGFGLNRPSLLASLPKALQLAEKAASNASAGISDLFGLSAAADGGEGDVSAVLEPDWTPQVLLTREKDTLGFYLSGHPIEAYRDLIDAIASGRLSKLLSQHGGGSFDSGSGGGSDDDEGGAPPPRRRPRRTSVTVGVWLSDIRNVGGDRPGKLLTLDDQGAQLISWIDSDTWMRFKDRLRKDTLIFATGELGYAQREGRDPEWRLYAREFRDMDAVIGGCVEQLQIDMGTAPPDLRAMQALLMPYRQPDGANIVVDYATAKARGSLQLGAAWRVKLDAAAVEKLRSLTGSERLRLHYRKWRPPENRAEAAYSD